MALTFESGDPDRPRGHAVLYFRTPDQHLLATYLLVLPIKMDVAKYLPPLLAAQFGSVGPELLGVGIHAFAAPPLPEPVVNSAFLSAVAQRRSDDLVFGGELDLTDLTAALQHTTEVVQEYARLYEATAGPALAGAQGVPQASTEAEPSVQRVLYGLMSERDRLGELSRLIGTLRFAIDRKDTALAEETEAALRTIEELLPEHYWVRRVREAARDVTDAGATLARLYVERCYKMADEDYSGVADVERRIKATEALG